METVYDKYKKYRSDGIPFDDDFDIETFFKEENELLTQVYDEFGQFAA